MATASMVDDALRVARLAPPSAGSAVDMILDTDTYNEIDDQFALGYALLSPQRLRVQAVYAAPFVNQRAASPGEGMEKSHGEILEVFKRLARRPDGLVFRGSPQWLKDSPAPVKSPAMEDLIARAMARPADGPPLYVVAIGAPTNVASAIAACPEIASRIVVVWLGGHPHYWPHTWEFNLQQDPASSHVLLDSGVPLVHVPACNVSQKLRTSVAELKQHLVGDCPFCRFLIDRFSEYETYEGPQKVQTNAGRPIAYNKEIWDVATVAWLVDPSWCDSALMPSPILTSQMTWSFDPRRHLIRALTDLNRDAIFGDLFTKLRQV